MNNEIYLWNTRGRVTKVPSSELSELMGQGYLRPTESELLRIEKGELVYSQVYDRGSNAPARKYTTKTQTIKIEKMGDVLHTEEI